MEQPSKTNTVRETVLKPKRRKVTQNRRDAGIVVGVSVSLTAAALIIFASTIPV